METAVTSIVCIALIVVGGMTMSQNFMSSVDSSAAGLEEITVRDEEIVKTDIDTLSASATSKRVYITLRNTGQVKLRSFSQWDLIIQYRHGTDYYATWLPYVSGTPGDNQWTVTGIYVDAASTTPEVLDPNVLNPGEEMIIRAEVNPSISARTTAMAVISTPNGVSAAISFEN